MSIPARLQQCHGGVERAGRRRRCAAAAADPLPAAAADDGAGAPAAPTAPAPGQTPAAAAAAEMAAAAPKRSGAHWAVSEALCSVPITIIGDDTDLNWAVCRALSKRIGWFPCSTAKVLCGMHKVASIEELVARDGAEAVGEH